MSPQLLQKKNDVLTIFLLFVNYAKIFHKFYISKQIWYAIISYSGHFI